MNPMDDINKILLADQALMYFRNLVKQDPASKRYYEVIKSHIANDDEALMCLMEIMNIAQEENK